MWLVKKEIPQFTEQGGLPIGFSGEFPTFDGGVVSLTVWASSRDEAVSLLESTQLQGGYSLPFELDLSHTGPLVEACKDVRERRSLVPSPLITVTEFKNPQRDST